jgi:predicted  nucleic acid-binding Zn-ribbon protein
MKWLMCIGVVAMLVGCDASKDELQSTKTTLASVQKERDDLKAQVTTLQQQLDVAKSDLAKAKAAAPSATATANKTAPAESKSGANAPAKTKKAHKS